MIICPVEIQKLLVRQLRDHIRITAGFIGVRSVREQRILDHTVQHTFRRRKRSLHLIVYHAIVLQLSICRIQFVAPPFLTEDLVMLIDVRIKYCIHVYMH